MQGTIKIASEEGLRCRTSNVIVSNSEEIENEVKMTVLVLWSLKIALSYISRNTMETGELLEVMLLQKAADVP